MYFVTASLGTLLIVQVTVHMVTLFLCCLCMQMADTLSVARIPFLVWQKCTVGYSGLRLGGGGGGNIDACSGFEK